jgi:hypothetical protein
MLLRLNPQWPFASRCENPIGAITSVIGGFIGSNAATSGASLINNADKTAAQSTLDTTAGVNPAILNTASTAGQNAVDTAAAGGKSVIDTATKAGDTAIGTAATGAADATTAANNAAAGVNTATTSANDLLNPYASAGADASGTLQSGLAAGGDFNKTPSLSDLQMDPGYAFRLQQGTAALDRSAAARGGVTSGGNIKAQTDYAQGSASQEYQNAFNRFETSTQNRYNNLSGVANRGISAATTQGGNLIGASTYGGNVGINAAQYGGTLNENASQFAGNLSTGAAGVAAGYNNAATQYQGNANINATDLTSANTIAAGNTANNYNVAGSTAIAQGKMGAANAWTGALNGVGNAAAYGGFGSNMMSNLFGGKGGTYAPMPAGAFNYMSQDPNGSGAAPNPFGFMGNG